MMYRTIPDSADGALQYESGGFINKIYRIVCCESAKFVICLL